jgi:hypothetical protein
VTTPGLPLFIPTQVCGAVGLDPATTPVDVCMDEVVANVREGGVSAPTSEATKGLPQVVANARDKGIDLKIVVLPENPGIDTPLRDIATQVGDAYPGSTVLVISPTFAGTYSPVYDRVTLEAGQDVAKIPGNPVLASQNFVDELTTPHFPWTPFTIVLVLGVALAAVATRILQVRAKRAAVAESPVPPSN